MKIESWGWLWWELLRWWHRRSGVPRLTGNYFLVTAVVKESARMLMTFVSHMRRHDDTTDHDAGVRSLCEINETSHIGHPSHYWGHSIMLDPKTFTIQNLVGVLAVARFWRVSALMWASLLRWGGSFVGGVKSQWESPESDFGKQFVNSPLPLRYLLIFSWGSCHRKSLIRILFISHEAGGAFEAPSSELAARDEELW